MKSCVKYLAVLLCMAIVGVYADTQFTIRDFGTLLCSERSEARSLNAHGQVAGKYFYKDRVCDFLWSPDDGLKILTDKGDKEIFPALNELGNVVGCSVKSTSWFSSTKIQRYTYTPKVGMKFSDPFARGDGFTFFYNKNFLIACNNTDLFKSTGSAIGSANTVSELTSSTDLVKCFPTAINNKWKILITADNPGIFKTSILGTYYLSIFDLISGEHTYLVEGKPFYGCGINDENLVIARDKDGKEGYYGSVETGMISLGKFIPVALNNHGDIVGKRGDEIFLRRFDGETVDLNYATILKNTGIQKIIDVHAINDQGQILVTAKISGKKHAFLVEPI